MSGADAAFASASGGGDWADVLFGELGAAIDADQTQRESVLAACSQIDAAIRALRPKVTAAAKAYRGGGGGGAGEDSVQHLFAGVSERMRELEKLLTRDTYWKFHHMWRTHMQTLVSMVASLTFFSSKTIARPDHVTNVLVI